MQTWPRRGVTAHANQFSVQPDNSDWPFAGATQPQCTNTTTMHQRCILQDSFTDMTGTTRPTQNIVTAVGKASTPAADASSHCMRFADQGRTWPRGVGLRSAQNCRILATIREIALCATQAVAQVRLSATKHALTRFQSMPPALQALHSTTRHAMRLTLPTNPGQHTYAQQKRRPHKRK